VEVEEEGGGEGDVQRSTRAFICISLTLRVYLSLLGSNTSTPWPLFTVAQMRRPLLPPPFAS
jgi:hypothetical protein